MRIEKLHSTDGKIAAQFCFERRDAGEFVGFIEGPQLLADPNALLLAAWLPAWAAGEKRLRIDGPVCPILLANVQVAASVLRGWFGDFPDFPEIECEFETREAQGPSAAFLSGGVDSLAMLREVSVDAAVLIDYQDISGVEKAETEARFRERCRICQDICDDIGVQLWPVRTNLRRLNKSMDFWIHRYHGSFLAAMAHALAVRKMYIAATYDAASLGCWGSHPLLDPNYSSARVDIRHHGLHLSRLDKVRILSDWPRALTLMNVCTSRQSRGANCGKCEKCVRTKLELLAVETKSDAFADADVTPEDVTAVSITTDYAWSCYLDVLPSLRAIGRSDLVSIIEQKRLARSSATSRGAMGLARLAEMGKGFLGSGLQLGRSSFRSLD